MPISKRAKEQTKKNAHSIASNLPNIAKYMWFIFDLRISIKTKQDHSIFDFNTDISQTRTRLLEHNMKGFFFHWQTAFFFQPNRLNYRAHTYGKIDVQIKPRSVRLESHTYKTKTTNSNQSYLLFCIVNHRMLINRFKTFQVNDFSFDLPKTDHFRGRSFIGCASFD